MCICVDCSWVDRCQAYHAVERQHGVPHLAEMPDFEPEAPRIHVSVMDLPDGQAGIEWDVRPAPAFRRIRTVAALLSWPGAAPMTALPLLLALHSCSDGFGMALLDPQQTGDGPLVQVHPDGRGLSNSLISRVQSLLPLSVGLSCRVLPWRRDPAASPAPASRW